MNTEKQFQERFDYVFSQVGTENWACYMQFFFSALKLRILRKKELYVPIAMKVYCSFISSLEDNEREKGIDVMMDIKKIMESFLALSDEEGESVENMIRRMLPNEREAIRDYFRKKLNVEIFDLYNDSKLHYSDEERISDAFKEIENVDCLDEFMIIKEDLDAETVFNTFEEYAIFEPNHPFDGSEVEKEYNMMHIYRGDEHLHITVTPSVLNETFVSIRII